jgi:DNA-binding CsgD family transcriptional regulator
MGNRMESDSQVFEEMHEILHLANVAPDINSLRRKIIDLLFRRVYAESSVFFVPDEELKSTGGIEVNIEDSYVRQYKKYFHQYDPIQLIKGPHCRKRVIRLEELIDYHSFVSSKFYCDFLRPQKIHHKLYINLYTCDRYHGRIALYRPAGSEGFSKEDLHVLGIMAPFFAFALDHNELCTRTRLRESILNIVDKNLSIGIILLDDSMRPVYMNQKAKAFCQSLIGCRPVGNEFIPVPATLLNHCRGLAEELKRCQRDAFVLPQYTVVQINDFQKFHVSSRALEQVLSKGERLFMIAIEEMPESKRFDQERLKKIYGLTDREIDIVVQTCQGLTNAEIAQKLFVSEVTVKKHIQNVFQKMGVKHRAALFHKILQEFHESDLPRC